MVADCKLMYRQLNIFYYFYFKRQFFFVLPLLNINCQKTTGESFTKMKFSSWKFLEGWWPYELSGGSGVILSHNQRPLDLSKCRLTFTSKLVVERTTFA